MTASTRGTRPALGVLTVQAGRLGSYPLDSNRFEAPELRRLPEQPLVSCLCVTENRPAFMPWLLWSYDRQSWRRRELVVVDSSEPPISLPSRADVRVLRAPLGTSLGKKRNLALEAARGQVIAWFDDDDWQHPQRLSLLVPLLRRSAEELGASFLGPSHGYFIDLQARRGELYRVPRYAIFNGSVFYTHMVRHARFPEDVLRTEDTRWLHTLLRTRQGATLSGDHPALFLWLCHDANITNQTSNRRLGLDLSQLISGLGSAWADTSEQLAALRERLSKQPSRPPARLALAGSGAGNAPAPRRRSGTSVPRAAASLPQRRAPYCTPSGSRLAIYWRSNGAASTARDARYLPAEGPGDLYFTQLAIGIRSRNEWQDADYVGLLGPHAGRNLTLDELSGAIERDSRRADVYLFGNHERTTLRRLLAAHPRGEALARHALVRRLGLRESAFERQLLLPSAGWVSRPRVFSEYVRSWLGPCRNVLENRHDPELRELLAPRNDGNAPLDKAILATLAPLAFALGSYRIGLVRPSVEARARTR